MRAIFADPIYSLIALAIGAAFLLGLAALAAPYIEVNNARELLRLVVGARVPPIFVAWARRIVTLLVAGALTAIGRWTGLVQDTAETLTLAGVIVGMMETGWGALDQALKPKQNATDPPPVAGGGDATLLQP